MDPSPEPITHPKWLVGPDVVPWAEVVERLTESRHYWVATTRHDGTPHTRPIDGVWFEGRLVLSPGGGFWMMRNVRRQPEVSVHPEQAEGLVVIVEGVASHAVDPDWKDRAIGLYDAKYNLSYAQYWEHGTIEVRPKRVYAWRVTGPTTTNCGTRFSL